MSKAVYYKKLEDYIMVNTAKSVLEHLDEMFPIVRASELTLEDKFMQHSPVGWVQGRVMNTLCERIPKGIQEFRMPRLAPSFDNEGNLVFEGKRNPGVGKLYTEWKIIFEGFLPEKNSRMTTDVEYDIFCGILIKQMVERGCNVARAWYEVCNESLLLGHFWDSHGAKKIFELTGSRPQGVWCDLGNTRKVITDEAGENFFTVSGSYKDSSQSFAIASKDELMYNDYTAEFSTGLMSMDV